jgi:hypothetical protein
MASDQIRVFVKLPVLTAGPKHCSNNCDQLDTFKSKDEYVASCLLFQSKNMRWDKKRKKNGYRRCKECRDAEV